MRFSILGSTVQQVQAVGAINIKEARAIKLIFAELSEVQVARLQATGCKVTKVEKVRASVITPPVVPPTPVEGAPTYSPSELVWASGFEDFRKTIVPPLYGSGFAVAILDSGILETHEMIKGRVVYSKNFTTSPMRDGFNHGTGVTSIIATVAPLCNILNMKVLDDVGEGTEEEVVLAIDDCILMLDEVPELQPRVINLSLGTPDTGDPDEPIRIASRAAVERGIWVSAAAGNDGPDVQTILSPACERYVFATGSVGYEPFVVSPWSSRGPTKEGVTKPDAVFFGEDIQMASSEGDTATIAKSGTSFATPFCTGIAIVFIEGAVRYGLVEYTGEVPPGVVPGMSGLITMEQLLDTYLEGICIKPGGSLQGKDNNAGFGMPFGSLLGQSMGIGLAVDVSTMLTGMVAIAMMGMMMGMMK